MREKSARERTERNQARVKAMLSDLTPCTQQQRAEDRRFFDRRRFDQGTFWYAPEPRSLPPSTWPALVEAIKKWGIPAGFRIGTACARKV